MKKFDITEYNGNRFIPIDHEELTALELISKMTIKTNNVIDELDKKVDQGGDFTGSWHGINKPTLSEEGMRGMVEKHDAEITELKDKFKIVNNPEFHILQPPYGKPGDCSVFRTCEGKWVMVDVGEYDSLFHHKPQLDKLGCTELEHLFITHAHSDHIGDVEAVIRAYKPKKIYFKTLEWAKLPEVEIEWKSEYYHNKMLSVGREIGAELIELEDRAYQISPLEYIHCFGSKYFNYSDMNHNSVMFMYDYHSSFRILIAGDATTSTESAILGKVGKVEVYKMNHHGAGPGPSIAFLSEINPNIALVGGIDGLADRTEIVKNCKNAIWMGSKVYDTWVDNIGCHMVIGNGACHHIMRERKFDRQWIDLEDGNTAYILDGGSLAKNQIISYKCDYYFIEDNYRMASNKFIPMGLDYYYAGVGGQLYRNQWLLHTDENYYYMKLSGLCARSESLYIDGKVYEFDNNGVCLNPNL